METGWPVICPRRRADLAPLTFALGFRSPGKDNVRAVSEMLASFAIMPFTAVLGMSTTRCAQMVRDAQAELLKPNVKIYNRV